MIACVETQNFASLHIVGAIHELPLQEDGRDAVSTVQIPPYQRG